MLLAKRARAREFCVLKKDVNRFGQTAGCPGCGDASLGISERHAYNDERRNRVDELLMDEGAQRFESYFDRARVEAGAAVGPALTTTPGDLATAKRKAEETGEADAQPKKRQTAVNPAS